MIYSFLRYLGVIGIFSLLTINARADDAAGKSLQLLGRSTIGQLDFRLSGDDRRWLKRKRQLVLGAAPDYPPFDISSSERDYEGITADYIAILGKMMGVEVSVRRFATRRAALNALANGQIDLLGSANSADTYDDRFVLSSAYATDRPVLVTRIDEQREAVQGAGMRLAIVANYRSLDAVNKFYPDAQLEIFQSYRKAIGAVAFGQADMFLGDAISANYLITKSYFNNLQLSNIIPLRSSGYGFAMRREDAHLLRSINILLGAIPIDERNMILRRWSLGSAAYLSDAKLDLTPGEEKWLAQHRTVHVLVNGLYAPMTSFDDEGRFQGITADVLRLIRLRTGLKFEVSRSDSVPEMVKRVSQEKEDFIGALGIGKERQQGVDFTRPYLVSAFVLVSRNGKYAPVSLDRLQDRSLALPLDNPLIPMLQQKYPRVRLVLVANAVEGLKKLAQGSVDAAVSTLAGANYYINRYFKDDLRIVSVVGDEPARISFGVRQSAPELLSILDKALSSIPPEELATLTSRWRSNTDNTDATANAWNIRSHIYQVIGVAVVLVIGFVVWIGYLRRQISHRKLAERALGDQLEFMHALIDGTPNPIYVRDSNGRLILCNRAYLDFFGVERQQVMDKTLQEALVGTSESEEKYHRLHQETMQTGRRIFRDDEIQARGSMFRIYHWILPYKDSMGNLVGIIGGWLDITERERLVQELQHSKELADEASQAKSTFLATMSHEIRTPMNAIIGMLELALKYADQGRWERSSIEVAYNSAHALLDLIGDILDIAKIESGKLDLFPQRANIRELIESVVRVFDGLARKKGLQLRLQIDSQIQGDVLIDPQRFKQIAFNLIGNAIKFTDQGQIIVRLEGDLLEPERLLVRFSVEDSGIGISPASQEKLFSPFSQGQTTKSNARSGTGLGLVISRKLVEMMGGQLHLSSELGLGTLILVTFSVAVLQPVAEAATPALAGFDDLKNVRMLRVLVVDDHAPNRMVITQQLQFLGHEVAVAQDGETAMKLWAPGFFDLIITDCNMPIVDGYELAREIRQAEQGNPEIAQCTIFGFTANAQAEELARCREAGMNDCLFKPIGLEMLRDRLALVDAIHPLASGDGKILALPMDAKIFDRETLDQLTGGNAAIAEDLLREMIKSNQQDLSQMNQHLQDAEWGGILDVAHRVKGGARITKADSLIAACTALESACHEPVNEPDVFEKVETVCTEIRKLESVLSEELSRLVSC